MTISRLQIRHLMTLLVLGVVAALANPFCCFNSLHWIDESAEAREGWSELEGACAGKPESVLHDSLVPAPPVYVRAEVMPLRVGDDVREVFIFQPCKALLSMKKPPPKRGDMLALLI